jgi:hypothetical protein
VDCEGVILLCNADTILIVNPMSNARRWKSVTARNALITARHVPILARIASSGRNVSSGKYVGRVKRDITLKKKQRIKKSNASAYYASFNQFSHLRCCTRSNSLRLFIT